MNKVDIKGIEIQLKDLRDRLSEAEKLISDALTMLSHDDFGEEDDPLGMLAESLTIIAKIK